MSEKIKRLDHIAERSRRKHLQKLSQTHLEAAVGSLMTCHSIGDVCKRLRRYADHLEEFE